MSGRLLVVATRNAHKTDEIRAILGKGWLVEDLSSHPEAPEVDETGETFTDNACLKAVSASRCIAGIILADDSGLEVDELGGKPGVRSSRFGGEEGNHELNNRQLIAELEGKGLDCSPARFRCVMVLAERGNVLGRFSGTVEGMVVTAPAGDGGFGYDPLFIPEGEDLTFAQLPGDVKNSMSHRGRALEKAMDFLKTLPG